MFEIGRTNLNDIAPRILHVQGRLAVGQRYSFADALPACRLYFVRQRLRLRRGHCNMKEAPACPRSGIERGRTRNGSALVWRIEELKNLEPDLVFGAQVRNPDIVKVRTVD